MALGVQLPHLVAYPAVAATCFFLNFRVLVQGRELLQHLRALLLVVQALTVVLHPLVSADLKASQIWGRAVVQQSPRVPLYRSSDMRRWSYD